MLFLRSLAFNAAFYLNLTVFMIGFAVIFFLPRRIGLPVIKLWAKSSIWWLEKIAGVKFEVEGLENLPQGPFILASKHQSAFETFALLTLVDEPVFILKRELLFLPIFGWYLQKFEMIPIDRSKGRKAIEGFMPKVMAAFEKGRQLIIFPEGTRTKPGATPHYKVGVGHIYEAGNVPCVPVALNSGLHWPRNGFFRYPGTIRFRILPPIAPGLSLTDFLVRLENEIETATRELEAQG